MYSRLNEVVGQYLFERLSIDFSVVVETINAKHHGGIGVEPHFCCLFAEALHQSPVKVTNQLLEAAGILYGIKNVECERFAIAQF